MTSALIWWVASSVGIFLAVVAWRRIFPAPMPGFAAPTLDTACRRRHFSPEVAAERHGLGPGMRVLEIGPGIGYLTGAAAERIGPHGRLVSLDLQLSLLTKLRDRLGPATPPLVRGDATRLPFRGASFDLVYLSSVLGEIPDKPGAMREFGRVLRSGGTLAVSEEIIFDPDYVRLPVARRLAAGAGFAPGEYFGQRFRYTQRFVAPAARARR
jgi:SAM-dependent methyltransferase